MRFLLLLLVLLLCWEGYGVKVRDVVGGDSAGAGGGALVALLILALDGIVCTF